ncbi:MAG: lysophospholipid acyltransferase family protein [Candidatus Aminicenantes bacterium]|nr:MAG: lysophospholipid acyltransferase family protein [Candidatus Aminicenantes bacterium]
MSALRKVRHNLTGILGKWILWLWAKSARTTVLGEEHYKELRNQKKPVIILIWHGRIFFAPYFFRRRGIMPLVSPSEDGEIIAQIIARWGYKNLRGSSSHSIIKSWNEMKRELERGGELIIVPDGPRGPSREMKPGAVKLAKETGAYLVPFTFSSSKGKTLKSWDQFLIPRPFTKFVAIYGKPISIESSLDNQELRIKLREVEEYMIELDREADCFFG